MISAVAARKAALAAQQAASTSQSTTGKDALVSSSQKSSPNPPSTARSKPPSTKRKSSSQKSRPEVKKSRNLKPKIQSDSMDMFKEQTDVIAIESEGSDEEGIDTGVSTDSDAEYDLGQNTASKRQSKKRAWSPSMPVDADGASDSSLDDEDIDDGEPFAGLDVTTLLPPPAHTRASQGSPEKDSRSASTFEPSVDENIFFLTEEETNALGSMGTSTLVGLNFHDTLCLLGTCTFILLQGSLQVNGTRIRPSSEKHRLFAPRSSVLPLFKCGPEKLSPLPSSSVPKRLQGLFAHRVVIMFQELRTGVESLGRACRTFENAFDLPRSPPDCGQKPFKIQGLSMVSQPTKDMQPFVPVASWSKALHDLAPSTATHSGIYLIKGPKNVGKSTFSRNLVNHLLTIYRQVAYLECDLGQSEFTPGGMVTLNIVSSPIFGPPFTHPSVPFSSHFVGHTTPRSTPSHYIECILSLVQKYRTDVQVCGDDMDEDNDSRISEFIPLVVNTMGWTKGLGADLTQKIQDMVEPTDIFDIQQTSHHPITQALPPVIGQRGQYTAYRNGPMVEEQNVRVRLLEQAPSTTLAGYTSADHRAISVLSYFMAHFRPVRTGHANYGGVGQWEVSGWDVSRPLCALPPYAVDCSVALDKVVLTGAGTEDVVESEIGRVLNGAIVGLVSCEAGAVEIDDGPNSSGSSSSSGIPYTQQAPPPLPQVSNCIGIALIRGVSLPTSVEGMDVDQSQPTTILQILTPLPPHLLLQANARVLVKGEMELPVWGMLDFQRDREGDLGDVAGVERDKVPYLQWGKGPEGVIGGDKKRVRRNLMRKGQS